MAKINLIVDDYTWETFRIACIRRKISASKAAERLFQYQLAQWETEKETSHD